MQWQRSAPGRDGSRANRAAQHQRSHRRERRRIGSARKRVAASATITPAAMPYRATRRTAPAPTDMTCLLDGVKQPAQAKIGTLQRQIGFGLHTWTIKAQVIGIERPGAGCWVPALGRSGPGREIGGRVFSFWGGVRQWLRISWSRLPDCQRPGGQVASGYRGSRRRVVGLGPPPTSGTQGAEAPA